MKFTRYSVTLLAAGALATTACETDLTALNVNPNSPTTAPAGPLFTNAVQSEVNRFAGFSLSGTSVSVAQGASGNSTVTITRTGGYAGAVALTATGLPANVSAAFSLTPTTGNTSVLTFTTTGAAAGTYNITVNGTGPAAANQSTTLTLTIP